MSLSLISSQVPSRAAPAAPIAPGLHVTSDSRIPAAPVISPVAVTAPEHPGATAQVEKKQLDDAVIALNKFLKPANSSIQFSIDESSGRTLVQVIDTDTMDVLRQFPSKEALAISQSLDKLQGLLVREKA